MSKTITIPDHNLDTTNKEGNLTGKVNTFLQLIGIILEVTPQKSEPDTVLAHGIRLKIDAEKKNQAGSIRLDDAELSFIQNGIEKLRTADKMTGSAWFYLIDALRNAKQDAVAAGK